MKRRTKLEAEAAMHKMSAPSNASPWPPPVTLGGEHVILTLLSPAHRDDLAEAVRDGELWKLWYTAIPDPDGMAAEIERRLALRARGSMLPFAVIERATGQARRVEIGSTWYRNRVQRTALNTECKLLLLGQAFDVLDCIAVEFRTASHNRQSRRAIERLGAKLDGILRNHQRYANGALRDTCVYSIIASEWPAVRAELESALGGP